jgi:hypothetical protein
MMITITRMWWRVSGASDRVSIREYPVQHLAERRNGELATYIIYKLFQKQKIDKKTAALLSEILDEILS